jgi:hypothetical protein
MPPTKAKRPTDRQPKAVTITPTPVNVYTFEHEGVTYSLPSGATAVPLLPGRALRDAYIDGEAGQMRLAFLMLEAIDADPAALDALYDMPAPVMLEHVQGWMSLAPVEGDASLGESLS